MERAIREAMMTLVGCDSLTPRETEVLNFVRLRLSNKEIGSNLNISERTVKYHVSSLLRKFRVDSRAYLL